MKINRPLLFFLTFLLFSPHISVAKEGSPSFVGSKVIETYIETLEVGPGNAEAEKVSLKGKSVPIKVYHVEKII